MSIAAAFLIGSVFAPMAVGQPWGEIATKLSSQTPPTQLIALNRAYICPVDDTPITVTDNPEPQFADRWKTLGDKFVQQDPWDNRDGWGEEIPVEENGVTDHLPKVIILYCEAVMRHKEDTTQPPVQNTKIARLILRLDETDLPKAVQYKDRFGGIWPAGRVGETKALTLHFQSTTRQGYIFFDLAKDKYPDFTDLVIITGLVGEPVIREVLSPH